MYRNLDRILIHRQLKTAPGKWAAGTFPLQLSQISKKRKIRYRIKEFNTSKPERRRQTEQNLKQMTNKKKLYEQIKTQPDTENNEKHAHSKNKD